LDREYAPAGLRELSCSYDTARGRTDVWGLSNRPHAESDGSALTDDRPQFAVIAREATPYWLHVLGRISREIPQAGLHSIFTHADLTMPWQVQLEGDIRPVTFPGLSLTASPVSRFSFPLYRRIRDYLIEQRIRLVILLGYNSLTHLLLMHWAQRQGVPLLLSGDSNIFCDSGHGVVLRTAKRWYIRHVLQVVSGLMPMGTCGRAYFRQYADYDKPSFLFPYEPDYNRLSSCHPDSRQAFALRHGLDPARRRLLYCGRLVPLKCVDTLLEAFERIADFRPDWDLVIAGDGPLRRALEAQVSERVRSRVKWLGFLQFDELAACYHCCDAFVLPSEYEPWGLVINEAVAAGLPVVAAEGVGAAVEMVRHGTNGFLVPARDVGALRDAIVEVTDADCNRRMRAAAPEILRQWRIAADPVNGVRQALSRFLVTV
jgi:glycosyltransferase involved in cell wall biosynthesis